ncbi:type II toxin-antitoxin system VapC family toxin [Chitinimonas arctica]|uniref:Ribonuclease VapC n=1 Tax=Chitinimonas arctica TaxID=2594795 RepID=A0A516SLD1_9NEIS|nr:type II toxin-antitoxin system VapC family toxin [Chitinimonas arctica]QDQ28970.1 type II toxin-antitoxin system VapC family toxin [Chitinimonas arctica]
MPRYMLDTNMCIYLMKNQPEAVSQRFAQCYVGDVVISAITLAELEFGVSVCADSERERQNLDALIELIEVKPFEGNAARFYGPARKATRDRKSDHLDKLIAAHAMSLGATLVTNNESDFAAYPGLVVENWIKG